MASQYSVTRDPDAGALYVRLTADQPGQIHSTRELEHGVLLDLNQRGEPVGVEILEGIAVDPGSFPEIWVVSDAMTYMGVSRQRINQLYESYPDELPAIYRAPGSRAPRLWLAATWRRFATLQRRPGGRPPHSFTADQEDVL